MRPIRKIYREFYRQQRILNRMPMDDYPALLRQSRVVDKLHMEIERTLVAARVRQAA